MRNANRQWTTTAAVIPVVVALFVFCFGPDVRAQSSCSGANCGRHTSAGELADHCPVGSPSKKGPAPAFQFDSNPAHTTITEVTVRPDRNFIKSETVKYIKHPCVATGCGSEQVGVWYERVVLKKTKVPINPKCGMGGDPVLLPTGEFVDGVVDLATPTRGEATVFMRQYSSQRDLSNVVGRGWISTAHRRLTVDDPGNVTVNYVAGNGLKFTKNGDGTYSPQEGSFETLVKVGSDYVLTFTDGENWYFDGTGKRCTKSADVRGLETLYVYDGTGNMTGVTDAASRTYSLAYDDGGHLTKLTDFNNRSVTYEYDLGQSTLTKVTQPWGSGGTYAYVAYNYYTSGAAQYKLNTRTTSGMSGADLTLYYDSAVRVTRQTLGVGDYTYDYAANNAITQTNREGCKQVWYFTDAGTKTKDVALTTHGLRDGEGDYPTSYAFDNNGLPLTRLLASNTSEQLLYDAKGNPTKRIVSRDGNSLTEVAWFDANNNRVSHQSADGGVTQYVYDGSRNLKTKTLPSVTLGQETPQTIRFVYDHNAAGQVTRQVDPNGVVTTFLYDGNGYLTKRIDDNGGLSAATELKYDAVDNLTEQIGPEGAKVWYFYDGADRVTKEAVILDNNDPSKQHATTYWYSLSGLMASKKVENKDDEGNSLDPAEYVEQYSYDLEGRMTMGTYQVDATNTTTLKYLHDKEGQLTKTVDGEGNEASYTYDDRGLVFSKANCSGCSVSGAKYYVNGTGQVTKTVDANGNDPKFYYDAYDRVTRTEYLDQNSTLLYYEELEYSLQDKVTRRTVRDAQNTAVARTSNTYDEVNRLIETRDWANPASSQGNDDARTVYVYDASSRIITMKQYLSGTDASPVVATTSYVYDTGGRMVTMTNAEGGVTAYTYDAKGRLTKMIDPENKGTAYAYDKKDNLTRITNALGHYTVMKYDSSHNLLTTTSYALGDTVLAKSAYKYDGKDNVISKRHYSNPAGAADNTKDEVISFACDKNGNVTKVADPNGNSYSSLYDTSSRLQWSRDPLGNKVEYVYDANGNVLTRISYEIDQVGGVTKVFKLAKMYDALDRVTKITDQGKDGDITQAGDNGIVAIMYDSLGRKTRVTDPENVATSWSYDCLGWLTRMTEDVGGVNRDTDYTYDRAGRMTRIADVLAQSTNYTYDKLSRLTRAAYPDHDASADTVDQYYDKTGVVTKRVDQRGIATLYIYDSLYRLTKKQDDPTNPNTVEEYSHDALDRMTLAKLTRGGTEHSDVRYYYDGLSRPTRESQKIKGGTARNVDMAYDKGGNRVTLNYPSVKSVAYTYDADNRVSRILDGANARARYLYIGPSRRSQVQLLNGANTVSTYKLLYDGTARITSALYRNMSDDATIIGFEHAYDKTGTPQYERRIHQSNAGDAYIYDKLYRVTRTIYDDADPTSPTYAVARTEDFRVDTIGNRTKLYVKSANATEYLHNPVNEYTKVAGGDYLYDAAGNLTKDATYSYYWDYQNRLTKVKKASDNSDVAEYSYDANMRRIEKIDYTQTPSVTTRFYQDAGSDIEERDGNDAVTATYVNGPVIDEYLTMNRNSTEYWYMQSPIVGNIVALVNSSGVIQEGYTYAAYGTATVHTDAGNDGNWFTSDDTTATVSALGNPFMFTGRHYDAETGLHYFRFRMYDSATGIFISRDPLGYANGMSLYLGYFAPDGRDAFGLYNEDVHYFLTLFLARAAGFSEEDARNIAVSTQWVDDRPATHPGGLNWLRHNDIVLRYHYATPEQVAEFRAGASGPDASWQDIGDLLHSFEDTYSHQKGKCNNDSYNTDPPIVREHWHMRNGTNPDKTWLRPELADKMAQDVYNQLRALADQRGIAANKQWSDIAEIVADFNRYGRGWFETYYKKELILWRGYVGFGW